MLTVLQQHCLNGIGITRWVTRSATESMVAEPVDPTPFKEQVINTAVTKPVTTEPEVKDEPRSIQAFNLENWEMTLEAIEACSNCELATTCTRKVAGKGMQQADVMIIGEAPGHDEDIQGIPFVGRAGKLLDRMLNAINLDIKSVYVTNILKCRPPNNRDPKVDEIRSCSQFLAAQVKLVQPKVILSVGRISAQNLLHVHTPVGQLRNKQHVLPDTDIPLIVTYHPAYLLRNPPEKSKVWEDLKSLHRLLNHAAN